jgi:hypothetical protein
VHTPDEQAWDRDDLQQEIAEQNAPSVRAMRYSCAITIAICHPDISEDIPLGTVYVRGTPQQLRETFAEDVSEILRDLEIGISETWGTPLSFSRAGRAFYRSRLAIPRVVRHSRKRR